ncbi:MAG: outer membrane lipoprotein-sorting protein [Verrucomicrobia bacterium]|nr:outer membrane lipoprotein-sorting protein [Verrucomicrobiota bacterium]
MQTLPARADDLTAGQLISKVVDSRKTTGFRIRAKLILTKPGSGKRDTRQLLIKSRRDGDATKILYQALWPNEFKGRALLVEKSGDGRTTGFLFEPPDKVTPLTPELMTRQFLDSDLAIEDLTEDFWRWPSQKIIGDETVDMKPCKIVESRPPDGLVTSYSLIKSWISPEMSLPMRLHKFGKDGKLVKRFNVEKLIKQENNRWAPATLVIEPADDSHRTMLDGSKSERDIEIPAEDFTLEKIKALATAE